MRLIKKSESLYNKLFCKQNILEFEKWIVGLAVIAFLVHILAILFNNTTDIFNDYFFNDTNYLKALNTPLTIILFYEVLLLVLSIPKSIIATVRKQFEIVSLILIREVFKIISSLEDPSELTTANEYFDDIIYLLIGSVVCFVIVSIFYILGKPFLESYSRIDNKQFTGVKKFITLNLILVLIGLAFYHIYDNVRFLVDGVEYNFDYFTVLFSIMIFIDILIFLFSLLYSEDYELVFSESAFIVSVVLLRFALSLETSQKILLVSISTVFSGVILFLYYYFWIKKKRGDTHAVRLDEISCG